MAVLEINTHLETRCVCGFSFRWEDRSLDQLDVSQLRQEQHEYSCTEFPFTPIDQLWSGEYVISVYGACKEENPPWPT
jgi:hypothetical protein